MDAPLPTTPAPRLRRPGWRDPRLVIGVVLVACSVALGTWAVQSGRTTVGVYATTRAVVPGEPLAASDLTVVQAALPGHDGAYLLEAAELPADAVVLRAVGAGELVPVSALGRGGDLGARPVAVPTGAGLSSAVVPGALVDLWFVPAVRSGLGEPRLLAEQLVVSEVADSGGGLAPGGARAVHVLVPSPALPDVLAALGADGTMNVVPVPGLGS